MNRYKLVKAGIDVNQGIRRFNEDRALYERFLSTFPEDMHYLAMIEAIDKKDVKEAFQASHALKGIAGNLSLVALHADLIPLVELFRADEIEGVDELLTPVRNSYEQVVKVIKEATDPTI